MLCFRRTCPFGLPDDTETIDDIVLVSVGHALGAVTAHIVAEPLPAPLAALLGQLRRRERNAGRRPREATDRQRAAIPIAGASAAAAAQ